MNSTISPLASCRSAGGGTYLEPVLPEHRPAG